ncbi:MAG: methionine ABC transporter ATP-binding protein [Candidatus Adiutrix sp.]|jgi:D-methionine transport system ATP-binding protein|nr:methionine ABC transporter ATP-binding protein [Candidatus Adiutrix sp.]
MALIEISGLVKTFGRGSQAVEAIKGVDLSVEPGEIFGIVGASGAGKSTLIRCLNRLEKPTAGRVVVDGRDMTNLPEKELRQARREMGMIFQHFNLLSSRTAAGNVAFPLEAAGRPKGETGPRVAELLDLVGLTDKAGAYPAQLSGGQKQRVGIARALANNPKVLLCDEATSALDPQTTLSILALIKDIQSRLGLTVVLITHEMTVITEICDRVAVMEAGRIVEAGPVLDIFANPRHPASSGFVEAVVGRRNQETGYQPKGVLVRVFFLGAAAREPLVASLVRLFAVEPNILQAHIDHIKGTAFGTLVMDMTGGAESCREALNFLRAQNLKLEVLANAPDA